MRRAACLEASLHWHCYEQVGIPCIDARPDSELRDASILSPWTLHGTDREERRLWAAYQACPEVLEAQHEAEAPAATGRTGRIRKQVNLPMKEMH